MKKAKRVPLRRLTDEEKKRIAPFLRETWNYIAPDAGPIIDEAPERERHLCLIEFVMDADRMTMFTKITKEDKALVTDRWVHNHRDTMKWLRAELNY